MSATPAHKVLNFIRHAPSQPAGYLYGQTDADIGLIEGSVAEGVRGLIGAPDLVVCSPATRCQKTCDGVLSDDYPRETNADLWEQSFGRWDGLAFKELPDIGTLQDEALAAFAAPDGESFIDLCNRVQPVIRQICQMRVEENISLFVHAGVVRAALALAFGSYAAALKCEIDPLSVTNLRFLGDAGFSVMGVNQTVSS